MPCNLKDLIQNVILIFKEMQKSLALIADTGVKLTVIDKRLIYYWQYTSDMPRYYTDLLKQADHFASVSALEDNDEMKDNWGHLVFCHDIMTKELVGADNNSIRIKYALLWRWWHCISIASLNCSMGDNYEYN